MSRKTNRTSGIGAGNVPPAVTSRLALNPGLYNERREQTAVPTLDYLKIEGCKKLKMHPDIPTCREYFVKDSSLDSNHIKEDVEDIQQYDMLHSVPTCKSKMYIEGCSEGVFKQWIRVAKTLDELFITKCNIEMLGFIEEWKVNFAILRPDSLSRIYEWEYGSGTIRKLKIKDCGRLFPGLFPVFTSLQELEVDAIKDIDDLLPNMVKMTILEKLTLYLRLPEAEEGIIPKLSESVQCIPYVNTREEALFNVRPKLEVEGEPAGSTTSCSSNFSLLYQYHDYEIKRLIIKNLEHVERAEEVSEQKELAHYHQLQSLSFLWSSSHSVQHSSLCNDTAVLDKLQPHGNLETLRIQSFRGATFCSWMMNITSSLPNLTKIELVDMQWCEHIPPLGRLANLEVLHISNMPSIRKVVGDIYEAERPFMKLRELTLQDMDNLEDWTTTLATPNGQRLQNRHGDEIFPNLQLLAIMKCPRLTFVPAFPGSRRCTIERSSNVLSSGQYTGSSHLKSRTFEIKNCSLSSDDFKFLKYTVNLEQLSIHSCTNLVTLPDTIRRCLSLRKLDIVKCHNFSALPEWLGELTSLRKLTVHAAKLEHFPQSIRYLTALDTLVLTACNYRILERYTMGEDRDNIKHIKHLHAPERPVISFQRSGPQIVELQVEELHHVRTVKEAKNLDLKGKMNLLSLSLDWGSKYNRGIPNKHVLAKLLPCKNLEILHITKYTGADFPRWMSSLRNLVKLELSDVRIEHLHLDQLQSLKDLHISRLQSLGSKVCIWCTEPLRKLRRIDMSELSNQEFQISMERQGSDENLFPSLQDLELYCCAKLRFEPSIPRSARYILSGKGARPMKSLCYKTTRDLDLCPSFQRIMGPPIPLSLSKMEIRSMSGLSPASLKSLHNFDIGELTMDKCSGHVPVPESIREWKSLYKLERLNCEGITTLPIWLAEVTSLRELKVEVYRMKTLPKCIQQLSGLQTLTLSECREEFEDCYKFGKGKNMLVHIPNVSIERKI